MSGVERQAARFLVDVADAISAITSGNTSYGSFYVEEVTIGFEGETTNYRIIPNDHGDYDIAEVQP